MHLAPALCLFPFTTVVAIKKIQFLRCVIDFLDPNRTLSPHSALSRSGLVRRHLLLCLFTPNKSPQRVRSVLWASLYPPAKPSTTMQVWDVVSQINDTPSPRKPICFQKHPLPLPMPLPLLCPILWSGLCMPLFPQLLFGLPFL